MNDRQRDTTARSATDDLWGWEQGSEEVAAQVQAQEAADRERERELAEKAEHLRHGNAEVARAELAKRLQVDIRLVKPCIARIGADVIPAGERDLYAKVLGAELVKIGASEDTALGFLGWYASRCEQPPFAPDRYSIRSAQAWYRTFRRKQDAGDPAKGFGCGDHSPLLRFCICGAPKGMYNCPYIRQSMRPPKREAITTLLGAWNLMAAHEAPAGWTCQQEARRRLLFILIGALENRKGFGGAQLITSERELQEELPGRTTRKTIRADLRAMRAAGWVSYEPGQSRRAAPGLPARGSTIRRLFPASDPRSAEGPSSEIVAAALATFQGSRVER